MRASTPPSIIKYRDYRSYFIDYMEFRKARNPRFSHRLLARKLGWKGPYLSDIIQGHRRLTIAKALEFAKATGLSSLQAEHLIHLTLAESDNEDVAGFAARQLTITCAPQESPVFHSVGERRVHHPLASVDAAAVYMVLARERAILPAADVLAELPGLDHLRIERVQEILDGFEVGGIVQRGARPEVKPIDEIIEHLPIGFEISRHIHDIQADYLANTQRSLARPAKVKNHAGGFALVPRGEVDAVLAKLRALLVSIEEISDRALRASDGPGEDMELFQYGIHFFQVSKPTGEDGPTSSTVHEPRGVGASSAPQARI